jgi:AbgT putative transporter family
MKQTSQEARTLLLGAGVFLSLGRHPLAGLAAAFSGVAAVFGVNFLITPIDGILTEITNDAIHLLNPAYSIDLTANLYFAIVSSIVLCAVCTINEVPERGRRGDGCGGDVALRRGSLCRVDSSTGCLVSTGAPSGAEVNVHMGVS